LSFVPNTGFIRGQRALARLRGGPLRFCTTTARSPGGRRCARPPGPADGRA